MGFNHYNELSSCTTNSVDSILFLIIYTQKCKCSQWPMVNWNGHEMSLLRSKFSHCGFDVGSVQPGNTVFPHEMTLQSGTYSEMLKL